MDQNERPKSLAEIRDEQRLARALPSTHQPGVRFQSAARAASRDDERIRTARIAALTDFWRRRFGSDPSAEDIANHLNEGGDAA